MARLSDNNPITANGDYKFDVRAPDWHRVVIGTESARTFGGGTVSVKQDGLAYTDLSAVTAQTMKAVFLGEGQGVISLTGATTPSIGVKIERIRRTPQ